MGALIGLSVYESLVTAQECNCSDCRRSVEGVGDSFVEDQNPRWAPSAWLPVLEFRGWREVPGIGRQALREPGEDHQESLPPGRTTAVVPGAVYWCLECWVLSATNHRSENHEEQSCRNPISGCRAPDEIRDQDRRVPAFHQRRDSGHGPFRVGQPATGHARFSAAGTRRSRVGPIRRP